MSAWQPIETCPELEPVQFLRNGKVETGWLNPYADAIDYPYVIIDPDCVGGWNAFHVDSGPTHWRELDKSVGNMANDDKHREAARELFHSLGMDMPEGSDGDDVEHELLKLATALAEARQDGIREGMKRAVKVKALIWNEEELGWHTAETAFLDGYEVRRTNSGKIRYRFGNAGWRFFNGTIDEAKAAAQADYEARILSNIDEATQ